MGGGVVEKFCSTLPNFGYDFWLKMGQLYNVFKDILLLTVLSCIYALFVAKSNSVLKLQGGGGLISQCQNV